jgi:hypothetical protein
MLEWAPVKLKCYFLTLWNSFSSPSYYLEILNAPFSFSLKFFFTSFILLTLLSTLVFGMVTLPRYAKTAKTTLDSLLQNYPENLQISWNKSSLQLSPDQPLTLPYPSFFPQQDLPEHFVVIDPHFSNPAQAMDDMKTSTFVFINDKDVFVQNSDHQWTSSPLKEFPGFDQDFTITQQNLPETITQGKEILDVSQILVLIAYPIIYFVSVIIWRLAATIVNAIIIFYCLKLFGKNFPYGKILQISLHVIIVAETASILFALLPSQPGFPVFDLLYWLFMIVIFIGLRKVQFVPKKIKD